MASLPEKSVPGYFPNVRFLAFGFCMSMTFYSAGANSMCMNIYEFLTGKNGIFLGIRITLDVKFTSLSPIY